MKKIIALLFILLFILLWLVSCSKRVVSNQSDVKDSVHIEYVPREVIVQVPGDTVEIEKIIECDSVTNKPKPIEIKKRSGRSKINLKVNSSGTLQASASCDSLQKVITVLDKEVFRLKHEKKVSVETRTEYKTRRIDVICRWFTGLSILAAAGYLYVKMKEGLV